MTGPATFLPMPKPPPSPFMGDRGLMVLSQTQDLDQEQWVWETQINYGVGTIGHVTNNNHSIGQRMTKIVANKGLTDLETDRALTQPDQEQSHLWYSLLPCPYDQQLGRSTNKGGPGCSTSFPKGRWLQGERNRGPPLLGSRYSRRWRRRVWS